jgi:hypothetical protein
VVAIARVGVQNPLQLPPEEISILHHFLGGVRHELKISRGLFPHRIPPSLNALLLQIHRKVEGSRKGGLAPRIPHLNGILIEVPTRKRSDSQYHKDDEETAAHEPFPPGRFGF